MLLVLNYLKLKNQILLSGILPTILFLIIVVSSAHEGLQDYQKNKQADKAFSFLKSLSALITHIEKERKDSVLNSLLIRDIGKGNLAKNQSNTDAKIRSILNNYNSAKAPRMGGDVPYDPFVSLFIKDQLTEARMIMEYNKVNAVKKYNKVIAELISLIKSKALIIGSQGASFHVIAGIKMLEIQENINIKLIASIFISKGHDEFTATMQEADNRIDWVHDDFLLTPGIEKAKNHIKNSINKTLLTALTKSSERLRGQGETEIQVMLLNYEKIVGSLLYNVKYITDTVSKIIEESRISILIHIAFCAFSSILVILVSRKLSLMTSNRFSSGINDAIHSLNSYRKTGRFEKIKEIEGVDEISSLSRDFNKLVSEKVNIDKEMLLPLKAFEMAHEGVFILDKKGIIVSVNRSAISLSKKMEKDLVGHSMEEFMEVDVFAMNSKEEVASILKKSDNWTGEVKVIRLGEDNLSVTCSATCIRGNDGSVENYIAVLTDLTSIYQYQELLRKKALHDRLTGLPNSELAITYLEREISQSKKTKKAISVLYMDLNDFKYVNDNLGHDAGDQVLKIISTRIKESLKEDDLVSRQGGDEFLVILSDSPSDSVIAKIAKKIIRNIRAPIQVRGRDLRIGISIGISKFPNDGQSANKLIDTADMAMYKAKKEGAGKYKFFTEDINGQVTEKLLAESDLWKGLEEGEFKALYQPQIDLKTGLVVAAQAIAVWTKDGKTHMPEIDFRPIAEASGASAEIGKVVLEDSCEFSKNLTLLSSVNIPVSIKISSTGLRYSNVEEKISKTMEELSTDPRNIQVEINKNGLISEDNNIKDTLLKMSKMGLKIIVNDIMIGTIPFSYLRDYPIDIVKIDVSKVDNLFADPSSHDFLVGLIDFCKRLNIQVVATGVATAEQDLWVRDNGCDLGQGDFYSSAISQKEFFKHIGVSSNVKLLKVTDK